MVNSAARSLALNQGTSQDRIIQQRFKANLEFVYLKAVWMPRQLPGTNFIQSLTKFPFEVCAKLP